MLISIGEILVDIFDDGNNKTALPGGAPFNVACNALLYTKEVGFIGAVGNDEYGRLLIDTAKAKPFSFTNIKVSNDYYTSKAIVTLDNGERSFRFDRAGGADYRLDINDIDITSIKDEDIVHIGSLMLSEKCGRDFFYQLIDKIRASSKAKISFDINYRDDIFSSPSEAKKIFIDALSKADILKFSEDEIKLLSGKKYIEDGLKSLVRKDQIAVVTMGAYGSIFYGGGHIVTVPSYELKPIDTTGAGDAFYSYFLTSLVNHPNFFEDTNWILTYMTRANIAGALCTQKKGAIDSAPTEEEIMRFLLPFKK